MANLNKDKFNHLLDELDQKVLQLPFNDCWNVFCVLSDASRDLGSIEDTLATLAIRMEQRTLAIALLQENSNKLLSEYALENTRHFSIILQAILDKNPHAVILYMLQKQGVKDCTDEATVNPNHATAKDLILSPQQAQQLTGRSQTTGLCICPLDVLSIIAQRASHHGDSFTVADIFVSDSTNTNGRGRKVGVLYSSGEVRWDMDGHYSEPLVTVSNTALH